MAARDSVSLPTIIRGLGLFDSTGVNRTGSAIDQRYKSVIMYPCALDNVAKPELDCGYLHAIPYSF